MGIDIFPDEQGMIGPEMPMLANGGSTFGDVNRSLLTGHYFILPANTQLPAGLEVVADGQNVRPDAVHQPTHHTIFPRERMTWEQFVDLFVKLPWQCAGKKNMSATLTNPANLWQRVIDSHEQYSQAFQEFLTSSSDKIEVLRKALRGKDRFLALRALPSLGVDEKKALFPEWVDLARAAHSPFQVAWNVIESLPRAWMLQNIEKEVDAVLQNEEETDYWMFLQLYARIDTALMRKLAQRAAKHTDAAICELGEEYLAKAPVARSQP